MHAVADQDRAVAIMEDWTNERYKIIAKALNIIDPQGMLAPGTTSHNTIMETILAWMDELEADEVLRRSESARHILMFKRHSWL